MVQQLAAGGNVLPIGWVCVWCVVGISGPEHPTAVCKMETAQKRDAAVWSKASFHPSGELGVGCISVSFTEQKWHLGPALVETKRLWTMMEVKDKDHGLSL